MTRRLIAVFAGLIISTTLLAQAPPSAQPEVLLKAAMQKEQIDNDLPAALAQYKAIVEKFPKDPVAPKALLQMAGIYERQGQPQLAQQVYQRILATYPQSGEPARRARSEVETKPRSTSFTDRLAPLSDVQAAGAGQISRDGRFLSLSGDEGLSVIDLKTMADRLVAARPKVNGEWLGPSVWSPDGRELMFMRRFVQDGDIKSELRIVPQTGGPARLLKAFPVEARLFGWSLDGRFALVSQYEWTPANLLLEHVVVLALADGATRTVKTLGPFHNGLQAGIGRAAFSPDARFIAFDVLMEQAKKRVISVIALADPGGETLLEPDARASESLFDWSPAGDLVFIRDGSAWAARILKGRPATTPVLVARDVGSVESLGFTRDGQLYVRRKVGGFDVYVASIDSATGKVVDAPRLLNRPEPDVNREAVTWSPDGSQLAYWKSGRTLVIHNPSTGAQRTYALPLFGMTYPAWQPDGKAVVFRSTDSENRPGLYKVNLDTEAVEFLGPGFRVLFATDGRDMILRDRVRRDLTTGEESRLSYQGPGFPIARSRDGRLVALHASAERTITITPIDGGPPRSTIRDVAGLSSIGAFSPDGRFFYFVSHEGLVRAPVDGGAPQPTGIRLRNIYDFSVHPDGRQFAISSRWQPMEVRVWENLLPKGKQRE